MSENGVTAPGGRLVRAAIPTAPAGSIGEGCLGPPSADPFGWTTSRTHVVEQQPLAGGVADAIRDHTAAPIAALRNRSRRLGRGPRPVRGSRPARHCHHAVISGFFESSRVALFREAGLPLLHGGTPISVVRLVLEFRQL